MANNKKLADDWGAKLTVIGKAKEKLIEQGQKQGVTRCPCSSKGTRTMHVRVAGSRNHVRAWCTACDFRMME